LFGNKGRAWMRVRPRRAHGRDPPRTSDYREQQKTFFGTFLASTKKVPASRRIAEASTL
jgi:hypothetical protein